jgi:acetyltransferase-like isoleucine patch superfamily enzyme
MENVIIGFSLLNDESKEYLDVTIGDDALIRTGTVIYGDVTIGKNFYTGHNVLIREFTKIGDNVRIGSSTIIEGDCTLGNDINIQSNVYIPKHTKIGNNVFIAPCVVMTNDKYPPSSTDNLVGATIEDNVVIGANATLLPGIRLGKGCFVAAGAVVTKDVPADTMAIGSPAIFGNLPVEMRK